MPYRKHRRLFSFLTAMIITPCVLASCGRVKSADKLYKEAVRTYGDCEIVSKTETKELTELVLHDKLQDFDYKIESRMNSMVIDGSSFGSYPWTDCDFGSALSMKVVSDSLDELEAVCSEENAVFLSRLDEVNASLIIIRAGNEKDAAEASVRCAEVLQKQNLKGRLDNYKVEAYGNSRKNYFQDERYGSVVLPDIRWIDTEEEKEIFYTEQARMQTDSKAEFLRSEKRTFADTGADAERVLNTSAPDDSILPSSPVTFYYFRASDGSEYYLCDFNYYDEDFYRYSWYTNYKK